MKPFLKDLVLLTIILVTTSCSHKKSNASGYDATASILSTSGSIKQHGPFFFDWPVDRARLTRGFVPRRPRPHLGVDLAAPRGTPVLSAQRGIVIYAGRDFRGFGKMILIDSGHGWASIYAHLDKILVREGERVAPGKVIGKMGDTGRATGTHLHFEIRRNKLPVDPLLYLPGPHKVAKQ